ncbi:RagB/SusD family nutrient uptake outer membrane protein [Sinomicrobium sp. M5D2P17]
MKNIRILYSFSLIIPALLVCLVSCTDKLEDREGQLDANDLDYTNTEEAILPLIGAYYEFSTRGWEELLLLGVRGDDVNAGGLGDQQDYAETDLYNYNKDFWMYNSLWELHSRDIVNMNNAYEKLQLYKDFAEESDYALLDQYMAETRVLNAWLHFNLARVWGDVFIITTSQPEEEIENGPSSKEEVMTYISDLMDEVIPHLPDQRPNEREDLQGGVTKYTAFAIKAMAKLELEDYQGVADACGEIINSGKFSLYPDFYQLFKKEGELSNESLLEMQYSDYGNSTGDTHYHEWAPFGPQNWTPARENASGGWGFYEPSIKFIKFMLDRGEKIRLETSVLFTDRGIAEIQEDPQYATLPEWVSNTTRDGDIINDFSRALFSSGKHYLPSVQLTDSRNQYSAGKNLICIRYAEVLLMYAEALTQGASSNGGPTALEAVNEVRDRANMELLGAVTHQDVIDEKFAEMAMELGVRYFDMIRLKTYNELSYDGRTFSADKEYLPYPQEQIDLLPLEN